MVITDKTVNKMNKEEFVKELEKMGFKSMDELNPDIKYREETWGFKPIKGTMGWTASYYCRPETMAFWSANSSKKLAEFKSRELKKSTDKIELLAVIRNVLIDSGDLEEIKVELLEEERKDE